MKVREFALADGTQLSLYRPAVGNYGWQPITLADRLVYRVR